jgi:hypothetical protein
MKSNTKWEERRVGEKIVLKRILKSRKLGNLKERTEDTNQLGLLVRYINFSATGDMILFLYRE